MMLSFVNVLRRSNCRKRRAYDSQGNGKSDAIHTFTSHLSNYNAAAGTPKRFSFCIRLGDERKAQPTACWIRSVTTLEKTESSLYFAEFEGREFKEKINYFLP